MWQQQNFNHAIALRKELEASGGATTRRGEAQIERLQEAASKEMRRNAEEYKLIEGNEVRYGTTVTLRHEGSGKFLAVSAQPSDLNHDARLVEVSPEFGEEMYFCVMPQLELLHSEGERIHHDDPVQLNVVSSPGLRLHVRPLRAAGQAHFEVLAATESTGFKMLCFRSVQAERLAAERVVAPLLFGGMPIRLLHVEANGYMQARCDPKNRTANLRRGEAASGNLVWVLEHVDVHDGSSLSWDAHVRLRHMGTEQLLALPIKPPKDVSAVVPTLNALGDETGTLFALVPQYANMQDASVNMGS